MIYRTASDGVAVEVAARLFRSRGSGDEDAMLVAEMQGRGAFAPPVHELDLSTASGLVLGAFDGTGAAVSRWAAEHVARLLGAPLSPLDATAMRGRLLEVFKETARRAAAAMRARTLAGMGTTATVAVAVRRALVLAHVGDSRAYVWRRGRLVQATRDDTLLSQILQGPDPNIAIGGSSIDVNDPEIAHLESIVTQVIGTSPDVRPFVDVLELRRGDRLLLCTDGLHRALGGAEIEAVLGGIDAARPACDALMDRAVEARRGDVDVGVAVAYFEDAKLVPPAEADVLDDWSNDAMRARRPPA